MIGFLLKVLGVMFVAIAGFAFGAFSAGMFFAETIAKYDGKNDKLGCKVCDALFRHRGELMSVSFMEMYNMCTEGDKIYRP